MAKEIKASITRSRDTILGDMIGALSLIVLLYTGLCLPGLF